MKSITRFTKNIRGNECLNCGTHISDESNFCSKCGQVNDTNRLSVKQYFSEYLNGFFNFDNRFLKTVLPLIFKPGKVTKEYIEGKRIKYVNPFQLYLHITILFFLVVGIFSTIDDYRSIDDSSAGIIPELNLNNENGMLDSIKSETLKELEENDVKIDSGTLSLIESGIQQVSVNKDSAKAEQKKRSDQRILEISQFVDSIWAKTETINYFNNNSIPVEHKDSLMDIILEQIDKKAGQLTDNDENINVDSFEKIFDGWEEIYKKGSIKKIGVRRLDSLFIAQKIDYEIPLGMVYGSDEKKGNFHTVKTFIEYHTDYPEVSTSKSLEKLGYSKSNWNIFLFSKAKEWGKAFKNKDNDFLGEIIDRILGRISVALFFLLPIFTLIVSLLYIRKKYNYTENLVFVFHVQTVFFLLLLIFMIVNRITGSEIGILIFFITFMIYLYKAMRNFYEQGRFKTFIKYILLNISFLALSLIGGTIISFLAFFI